MRALTVRVACFHMLLDFLKKQSNGGVAMDKYSKLASDAERQKKILLASEYWQLEINHAKNHQAKKVAKKRYARCRLKVYSYMNKSNKTGRYD